MVHFNLIRADGTPHVPLLLPPFVVLYTVVVAMPNLLVYVKILHAPPLPKLNFRFQIISDKKLYKIRGSKELIIFNIFKFLQIIFVVDEGGTFQPYLLSLILCLLHVQQIELHRIFPRDNQQRMKDTLTNQPALASPAVLCNATFPLYHLQLECSKLLCLDGE